jgi:hypothetical protein
MEAVEALLSPELREKRRRQRVLLKKLGSDLNTSITGGAAAELRALPSADNTSGDGGGDDGAGGDGGAKDDASESGVVGGDGSKGGGSRRSARNSWPMQATRERRR